MSQERLVGLALLHVHLDEVLIENIINQFAIVKNINLDIMYKNNKINLNV